ncbi:hypothetical protein BD410DRAFT_79608 [Rickenella mellea]|uniref:Uncharacterized protein n=1 Tax=Rickenella mellea TaxID=50990 RepID=A0A4Y7PLK9_9AGAM|nr:hypothetical protein BD410DRAFT_79608 [Rickenella mellea]
MMLVKDGDLYTRPGTLEQANMQTRIPSAAKLNTILSISTILSLIVTVLAAVNIHNILILATYVPLTVLTLIHHLIVYLPVLTSSNPVQTWTRDGTSVPRGLTTKIHLSLLGLLEICWLVGVIVTLVVGGASGFVVACAVFAIFEFLVLLRLFVVCAIGRRRCEKYSRRTSTDTSAAFGDESSLPTTDRDPPPSYESRTRHVSLS